MATKTSRKKKQESKVVPKKKEKEMSLSRDFDYKYGIFARIKNKDWSKEQIQFYFDKKGYPYGKSMNQKELVEELKKWEK